MADALPGAPAPVPAAIPAATQTTNDAGAPLAPLALLRQLDRWMQASGHDAGHPWRSAIAETLAEHGRTPAALLPSAVDGLLCGIAHRMSGLLELIDTTDGSLAVEPTRSIVAHAGWLADLGLQMCDTGPVKGGAAHWLMDDLDREGLAALGVKA